MKPIRGKKKTQHGRDGRDIKREHVDEVHIQNIIQR